MTPSPEELSAGQKAYQGLKAYQRFKISQQSKLAIFFNVLTGLFIVTQLVMQILACIYGHQYWKSTLIAAAILILLWSWRSLEETNRKNFELLKQLKAKFGPEIYDQIKKEPDSIHYKFFQKSYPP